MKRKIAVLWMMLLCTQSLAGCQKTPEDVIVTEKNKDNISLEQQIATLKNYIAQGNMDPYGYYSGDEVGEDYISGNIADYQSMLSTAPETVEKKQVKYLGIFEKQRTYHITKIKLGYSRIYDPRIDYKTGVLVPVWDFYGGIDADNKDGSSKDNGKYLNESFMTINAVDGTIIDRDLGY